MTGANLGRDAPCPEHGIDHMEESSAYTAAKTIVTPWVCLPVATEQTTTWSGQPRKDTSQPQEGPLKKAFIARKGQTEKA